MKASELTDEDLRLQLLALILAAPFLGDVPPVVAAEVAFKYVRTGRIELAEKRE